MQRLALLAAEEAVSMGFPLEAVLIFVAVVGVSLYLDLWLHRNDTQVTLGSAARTSLAWVGISLGFSAYLRFRYSSAHASLFISGWMLEKVLSVDNLLVFVAIFRYFRINTGLQRRVLYYGILGAILLRLAFVAMAGALRSIGPWVDFVFAAIVIASAIKMIGQGDEAADDEDFNNHRIVKLAQRFFAVVPRLDGQKFFVTAERARALVGGDASLLRPAKRYATPALLCMLVIEASDVMFAFDSVPAVVAVTREPLLVYSSMLFAVLGLRSLYFLLHALTKWLVHLDKAVVGLLLFVGVKLALHASNEMFHWPGWEPSPVVSALIILGVLGLGVVASLIWPAKPDAEATKKG